VFARVFLLLAQFGPSEKNDPNQDNGGGGGTTNRGEAIWAAARPSETAIDASMDNFVKDVVGGQDGQRLDIDNQTLGAPMQNTSSAETAMVGPVSVEAVRQLFKNYDFDDSGEISFEELKDMLVKMHESSEGKSLTPEQAEFDSTLVMKTLDSDGGGLIGQGNRTPIATCCLCWYCREDRVLLLFAHPVFSFFSFFGCSPGTTTAEFVQWIMAGLRLPQAIRHASAHGCSEGSRLQIFLCSVETLALRLMEEEQNVFAKKSSSILTSSPSPSLFKPMESSASVTTGSGETKQKESSEKMKRKKSLRRKGTAVMM